MLEIPGGTLYPVLPLRDIVVFPHMIVPLFVGRDKSVRALEDVMKDDKQILLVTQRDASLDHPKPADMYDVGTVGTVLQLLKLPDGIWTQPVFTYTRLSICTILAMPCFATASPNR